MATALCSQWDGNGSHRVFVSEAGPRTAATDQRVRRAARNADPFPGDVQWTRINAVHGDGSRALIFDVTVSRLGREYR